MRRMGLVLIFSSLWLGCDNNNNNVSNDLSMSGSNDLAMTGSTDLAGGGLPTAKLTRTDLVSDQAGAAHTDANLVNAWGLAFNPAGPAWVAANASGLAQVYDSTGAMLLSVTIPAPAGATDPAAPTGQIFNATAADFKGDKFILSTEDGLIVGWQTGTAAVMRVDSTAANAVYKGIASMSKAGTARLYAADFHNGKIDAFDNNYAPVTTTGGFTDPNLPSGFAPFNIVAIGTSLYVSYAKQDAMAHDDVSGAGNGFVDVFDFDGALQKRLISQGALNSPWGMAMAPANFGALSNLLLVGNFGDGGLHAYNPSTGVEAAKATDPNGGAFVIDGLWAIVFGPGTAGEATNQLFFTAGPSAESHGLYGRIDAQ
jgi:uncharacterized protein (TIGR03118 family)